MNATYSIIVVSYNNYEYIQEALSSILNQDYERIQLIVSDDASNVFDKSAVVRYIEHNRGSNLVGYTVNVNAENMGTVRHIESLIPLCTGEYFSIIAADDAYLDIGVISDFVRTFEEKGGEYGVVCSHVGMYDTDLRIQKSIFNPPDDVELINRGNKQLLLDEMAYRCVLAAMGTAYRKEAYKKVGVLSKQYTYVDDWTAHIRLALQEDVKFYFMDRITGKHRDGGISHGNERNKKESYFIYYKDLLNIFRNEVYPNLDRLSVPAARRAMQYYKDRCTRHLRDLAQYYQMDSPANPAPQASPTAIAGPRPIKRASLSSCIKIFLRNNSTISKIRAAAVLGLLLLIASATLPAIHWSGIELAVSIIFLIMGYAFLLAAILETGVNITLKAKTLLSQKNKW